MTVAYKVEDLQTKVEKVIGHIAWLLEEAQKPDSALDVDKEREIKKVNSTGNLAGKVPLPRQIRIIGSFI